MCGALASTSDLSLMKAVTSPSPHCWPPTATVRTSNTATTAPANNTQGVRIDLLLRVGVCDNLFCTRSPAHRARRRAAAAVVETLGCRAALWGRADLETQRAADPPPMAAAPGELPPLSLTFQGLGAAPVLPAGPIASVRTVFGSRPAAAQHSSSSPSRRRAQPSGSASPTRHQLPPDAQLAVLRALEALSDPDTCPRAVETLRSVAASLHDDGFPWFISAIRDSCGAARPAGRRCVQVLLLQWCSC